MIISDRRHFLTFTTAALATTVLPRIAAADAWPTGKPIRAVVPFTAGSTIDILGRIVLDPVARQLGATIVIENRGGAGGTLGSAQVAKADPDGFTLLINAAAHSGSPAAYPNLPYDASKDFAAVACFGSVPNVLLVAPSKGIKTIKEFAAKAKDGNMTFSSAGVGSATHWAAERFRVSAGFNATHVPFRGGPEALTEVMTGRIDFIFIGISSGLPFIKNDQLLPLTVSSAKRSPALPDVPTTLEAGFQELRLQLLERHAGAGEDTAPDRRPIVCGDHEGAGASGCAGQARGAGRRARTAHAGRDGCDDRPRNRAQSQDRQGGWTEVQLSAELGSAKRCRSFEIDAINAALSRESWLCPAAGCQARFAADGAMLW